jgi:ubiquinone/menaquinone biosynthesis C-methylase UbiE
MSRLHLFHRKKLPASSSWEPSSLVAPNGRRYLKEQPYVLPKDHQETERIKFQHRMLYAHLHRHLFAPVPPATVRHLLDVGCGSGAWLTDVAALFPNATLTGLDSDAEQIALANTVRHPHCQFLQGDVLAGLPFAEGTFEYTHMRCMILAIPAHSWPSVIGELVRVTTLGGWIELFDGGQGCEHVGPNMHQFVKWGEQVLAQRGFDVNVISHLSTMLRQAGAEHVREQQFTIPVGSWAGRTGELMEKDLLALFETFKTSLCIALSLQQGQVDTVLRALPHEWNTYHTSYTYLEVHGQRRQEGHHDSF